jgi:hypothetical protein
MLIQTIYPDFSPIPRGRLKLDLDQAAERLIVIDRVNAETLFLTTIGDNKTFNLMLPVAYANNKNICVLMLDDSDVYAAVAEDRLQLELVNTSWNAT